MAVSLPRSAPPQLAGYLAVLTASCFWATSGIFIKLIMSSSQTAAIALAFWRDLATFLVLLILNLSFNHGAPRLKRSHWRLMVALGVSVGLFHVALNFAVFLNGAAVTTIQQAAMPAIVIVVERLIWREALTRQKAIAVLLIFAGTVLISGVTAIGKQEISAAGVIAGFSIPTLYAAWSLLGKKLRNDYSPLPILTYAFGVAVLVLFPFQFHLTHPWPVDGELWLWFAGLVGVSTVGGFMVYTFGLGKLSAGAATILAMSEIVFSAILAHIYLHETLSVLEILGAIVIFIGIASLFAPNGWVKTRTPLLQRD
jgi:drug/metabolite transporter, DME family